MSDAATMRTLRFHAFGPPAEVLRLEKAALPVPGPDHIRVRVHACGLNPADWALCLGLFPGELPRGVGLDVAGVVDAVGDNVTDVRVGDRVLGPVEFATTSSAGASDYAILHHWGLAPTGLGMVEASALPMAVVTAMNGIEGLAVAEGQTLLVHGAGTMMGFAAVQMALLRGANVFATAGETFAGRLRELGVPVTAYGPGMVERVREMVGGSPDLVLDTAPPAGVIPDLIAIAGGDAKRVLTITDFQTAAQLGALSNFTAGVPPRYDALGEYAQLAADGRFSVPIARTFAFEDWREALEISAGGHARGKVVLLIVPESA